MDCFDYQLQMIFCSALKEKINKMMIILFLVFENSVSFANVLQSRNPEKVQQSCL